MLVLSTMRFDEPWLEAVRGVADDVQVAQVPAAHADELPADLLARAEVLYTTSVFPTPEQAPNLRWIQLDTAGADHVVGTPAWTRDVALTSLGGVSGRALAEYVLLMLLAHAHRLPAVLADRPARTWPSPEERWARYGPHPLLGRHVVVVGYGRLGRALGELLDAVGLQVTGVRRGAAAPTTEGPARIPVVTVDALDDVLAQADHVVLCVPATPETQGLLDARRLALLPAHATLVNVGRGGVVDEDALVAALDAGRLDWAALDVFAAEPLPPASPLWDHPKVWTTPHVAGLAPDYAEQVLALFAGNLERFLEGRPLLNAVDRGQGY